MNTLLGLALLSSSGCIVEAILIASAVSAIEKSTFVVVDYPTYTEVAGRLPALRPGYGRLYFYIADKAFDGGVLALWLTNPQGDVFKLRGIARKVRSENSKGHFRFIDLPVGSYTADMVGSDEGQERLRGQVIGIPVPDVVLASGEVVYLTNVSWIGLEYGFVPEEKARPKLEQCDYIGLESMLLPSDEGVPPSP